MRRCKYLRLYYYSASIFLKSTDKQVVEQIIDKIKQRVPSCQIAEHTLIQWRLYKLEEKGVEIGNWLIQDLCEHGWEPFAVTNYKLTDSQFDPAFTSGDMDIIHFRYEEEVA